MNIVCSTDDNFVQHCTVMLTSVLVNNDNVTVFLLTEGLSNLNIDILRKEVESKNGIFHFILVDSTIISKLPMPEAKNLTHISVATYYRLLMSDILPPEVDKVIYLDCDIIVRKSLKNLWETNINEYALGAVHQIFEEIESAKRLDYSISYGYFNAGVLLINLDYWRRFNIPTLLFKYIEENFKTIKYHDQDALNAVLHKVAYVLPCNWNMINYFFQKEIFKKEKEKIVELRSIHEEYKQLLLSELKNPTLIHYVSKPKPWQRYCLHSLRHEYYVYARMTINYNKIQRPNALLDLIHLICLNIIITLAFSKNLVLKIFKIRK